MPSALPLDEGEDAKAVTNVAPARYPRTVTALGSPPKAAILSFTHSNAILMSERP